jgi:predicted SprT family Zn-dependent metalloprotease
MTGPYTTKQLRAICRKVCIANGLRLKDFPKLQFVWSSRMYRTMGRALYAEQKITLSTVLFTVATEQQNRSTVIHEMCHLIAYKLYGSAGRGHGQAWKVCMVNAGETPEIYHSVKYEKPKVKKVIPSLVSSNTDGTVTITMSKRVFWDDGFASFFQSRSYRAADMDFEKEEREFYTYMMDVVFIKKGRNVHVVLPAKYVPYLIDDIDEINHYIQFYKDRDVSRELNRIDDQLRKIKEDD